MRAGIGDSLAFTLFSLIWALAVGGRVGGGYRLQSKNQVPHSALVVDRWIGSDVSTFHENAIQNAQRLCLFHNCP